MGAADLRSPPVERRRVLDTGLAGSGMPLVNMNHLVRERFNQRDSLPDKCAGYRNLMSLTVKCVPTKMLLAIRNPEFNVFPAWEIPAIERRGLAQELIGSPQGVWREGERHQTLMISPRNWTCLSSQTCTSSGINSLPSLNVRTPKPDRQLRGFASV